MDIVLYRWCQTNIESAYLNMIQYQQAGNDIPGVCVWGKSARFKI